MAHTHIRTKKHEFLQSAGGKLLFLSEGHKEPLVVEVSLRSQWKMAAQVIIPDLWLGFHSLPQLHSQKLVEKYLKIADLKTFFKGYTWIDSTFPVRLKIKTAFIICHLDVNNNEGFWLMQFCQKVKGLVSWSSLPPSSLQPSQSVPGVTDRMLVMQHAPLNTVSLLLTGQTIGPLCLTPVCNRQRDDICKSKFGKMLLEILNTTRNCSEWNVMI